MTTTGWEWEGQSLLERADLAGVKVRSRGRTITDADFSAMTNLTWTTSELHTNEAVMAEGSFGTRILAGACVIAFALGLATPAVVPELTRRGSVSSPSSATTTSDFARPFDQERPSMWRLR